VTAATAITPIDRRSLPRMELTKPAYSKTREVAHRG
jgi:hypothetical protein